MRHVISLTLLILSLAWVPAVDADADVPTVASFTESLQQHQGFYTFYHDQHNGKIYLQVKLN